MPVKLTIHMSNRTIATPAAPKSRSAGWTEIHYVAAETIAAAEAIIRNGAAPAGGIGILDRRAALLPMFAAIYRWDMQLFQNVPGLGEIPAGAVVPKYEGKPGLFNAVGDIPQMSILISSTLVGGQPQTVRWPVRCIPDDQVTAGELDLSVAFRGALVDYGSALNTQYGTYVDDRISPGCVGAPIFAIEVDGEVTGEGAIDFLAVGDLAKVLRTTNSDGRRTGGIYRVGSVNGAAGTVTLDNWDRGATEKGTIRKWQRAFASYAAVTTTGARQMIRKVGTPRDYKAQNRKART